MTSPSASGCGMRPPSWPNTIVPGSSPRSDGLPPLADVGVRVVGDIVPYQRRKLWLLNGPHSAFAYGGLLAGCETIADAAAHPAVSSFVRRLVDDILEVADRTPGVEPNAFAEESLRRFRNPELGHTCRQVGADGSRKLAQRLLPVVAARAFLGLPTDRFAVVVAVWLAAVTRLPLRGVVLPDVEDPDAAALRVAAEDRDRRALSHAALGRRATGDFADEVAGTLEQLVRHGIDVLREEP